MAIDDDIAAALAAAVERSKLNNYPFPDDQGGVKSPGATVHPALVQDAIALRELYVTKAQAALNTAVAQSAPLGTQVSTAQAAYETARQQLQIAQGSVQANVHEIAKQQAAIDAQQQQIAELQRRADEERARQQTIGEETLTRLGRSA